MRLANLSAHLIMFPVMSAAMPRRTQRTFEKSLAFVVRNVLRQMGPTEIARLLAIADNATPEKREILLDLVCRHEASLVDRDN